MSYAITSNALGEMKRYFEAVPDIAADAARMSMNDVAEGPGLAMMKRDIESQVAFPKGYLDLPDRLGVVKKATRNNLEVVIRGRDRATSLARFAPAQTPGSKSGVFVQVKRGGKTQHMKTAFLVRLKNGNRGLAIRLKEGETVPNKRKVATVMLEKNVYLLYGPSVDQVFETVAYESLPSIGDMVAKEFYRQFARLSR